MSTPDKSRLRALRRLVTEALPLSNADSRVEPFDELPADAALGVWRRLAVGRSAATMASSLVSHPTMVASNLGSLGAELSRIALGRSQLRPGKRDRRFRDPAWESNFALRRLLQVYLASSESARKVVEEAGLDWESAQTIEFLVDNVIEALAPTNNPLTNPAALRKARQTKGASWLQGFSNFVEDMSAAPRVPSMVNTAEFRVGGNLAVTPGSVIHREPLFELIQYAPATEEVSEVPLLLVPPMINKYYAFDLAPGRSMIEHFVAQGLQVFVISWRNPTAEHRDWGFDAYASGILAALDVVSEVSGSARAHLAGACSGGVVAAMLASHLAQQDSAERLASLTLLVTVLDVARAGLPRAVATERRARAIKATSVRKGYLDGRSLAEVFAWLRPGDLIWNYWVNNYLMGEDPPAFDILAWNADVTRMPAQLHHDFVDQGLGNTIATGTQALLGGAVDIGAIKLDTYLVAGVADHLTDWQSCYRTRALLGGPSRFVLSSSGHVAALVNPPGNPRAQYRVGEDPSVPASGFVAASQTVRGTWWDDIVAWLKERGDASRPAPKAPGSVEHPVLGDAPGTYVHEH